ncbi:hypothetical protein ALO_20302 [Acetonema longum DSM 6540]|uniref:Uncharacterized protein n=1 Tax=Acetonema longum DSM 6540 TaxID=1009370 RepID=F7NPL5_9FIRM|nr:hypothetical protein ALO_20302 [Acetonema longum DSM 6540]
MTGFKIRLGETNIPTAVLDGNLENAIRKTALDAK